MIFIFLELLFGTIQALVFALLTAIYVIMAGGATGTTNTRTVTTKRRIQTARTRCLRGISRIGRLIRESPTAS